MSVDSLNWNNLDASGLRFAIVVARFNSMITDKLLDGAREALAKAEVDVFQVPGAFELPLAAKMLAQTHRYHGIIALGAVIRGDTPHFDFVAGEAARGLQNVALETGIPVSFGVLTTDTLAQAEARSGKGRDAAMTAIEMARFAIRVAN
ncbi:MAG: 6,7-dimethyl-8-ribityllumazine synthase [Bryobacteraceae bacterium]